MAAFAAAALLVCASSGLGKSEGEFSADVTYDDAYPNMTAFGNASFVVNGPHVDVTGNLSETDYGSCDGGYTGITLRFASGEAIASGQSPGNGTDNTFQDRLSNATDEFNSNRPLVAEVRANTCSQDGSDPTFKANQRLTGEIRRTASPSPGPDPDTEKPQCGRRGGSKTCTSPLPGEGERVVVTEPVAPGDTRAVITARSKSAEKGEIDVLVRRDRVQETVVQCIFFSWAKLGRGEGSWGFLALQHCIDSARARAAGVSGSPGADAAAGCSVQGMRVKLNQDGDPESATLSRKGALEGRCRTSARGVRVAVRPRRSGQALRRAVGRRLRVVVTRDPRAEGEPEPGAILTTKTKTR